VFPLPNNAFQIVVADFFKQQLTLSFDVLNINDSFRLVPLDQFPQEFLPFDKREIAQIFVIEPQQIECVEDWRAPSRYYPSVRAFNNSLFISSLPKISISLLAKKNGINTTNISSMVAKTSLGSATVSEKLAAKD
jgi:hypothetical protein